MVAVASSASAKRNAQQDTSDSSGDFGSRLRRWREGQRKTLRQVADTSGISIAYLSDLERGKLTNPTLDTLSALAAALEVSLNAMLGLEEAPLVERRYSPALEELRHHPQFAAAVAAQAARWRQPQPDIEEAWLQSLLAIRVGRRVPRTADDYLFIFEAARRVLE